MTAPPNGRQRVLIFEDEKDGADMLRLLQLLECERHLSC